MSERARPWAGERLRFAAAVGAARRLPCVPRRLQGPWPSPGARQSAGTVSRPGSVHRCPGASAELALAAWPASCCAGCLCSVLKQAALDASPCGDAQPPVPCAPRRRRGAPPLARPRPLRAPPCGGLEDRSAVPEKIRTTITAASPTDSSTTAAPPAATALRRCARRCSPGWPRASRSTPASRAARAAPARSDVRASPRA